MGRLDFGQLATPPVSHQLHDDGDAVDGDAVERLQHRLPTEPELEPEAKPTERESANQLGFRWKVPLSWVHNPSGVLALYQDQLDAQTHDQVIVY